MRRKRTRLASYLTAACTTVVATGVVILASPAPAQAVSSNLAQYQPATADSSCNANEGPAKAVNGSVSGGSSDKWCSGGTTKYLQVDLGSAKSITSFTVRHAGAGGETAAWNTRGFNIQVSTNGADWTQKDAKTSNTLSVTNHPVTATTARYVRLNITEPTQPGSGSSAARIYEFEVYGSGLPSPVPCPGCWHPYKATTWNWVLNHVPTPAEWQNVQVLDIDGFNATAADVTALHNAGRKVICYISVGSWEEFRPDAGDFPEAIKGNPLDPPWTDERWLNISNIQQPGNKLAEIMSARLDMCASKGFDAVEFDNQDGAFNNTGFVLTPDDQLIYNTWLANGARSRGMSAVLKNDVDQIGALTPYYDMAINEECHDPDINECAAYASFISTAGKPVFNAEYNAAPAGFCSAANADNLNSVRFNLNLDGLKFEPCRANLALFKTATTDSSCNANEGPAKAINGSSWGGTSDKWCGNGSEKYLQVDLGSVRKVKQFIIRHAQAGGEAANLNTREFNIQVSTNGTTWNTVVANYINTGPHSYHTITPTDARYVKLDVVTGAQPGSGASFARIYDFEVYCHRDVATPCP